MASIEYMTTRTIAGAWQRGSEIRSAEVRRDSAKRDEERATRRLEEAERDLERVKDRRFDRYA